jgi:hypothetical protein
MVLAAGKLNVEKLLSGDAAGKKFVSIVVGTNPAPPTDTDSAITGPLVKPILSVNYLSGFIQFNSTLDATDPAMVIQEIGLLNEDGILCYRKVIPAVNKVAGTTYALAYKIKVQ